MLKKASSTVTIRLDSSPSSSAPQTSYVIASNAATVLSLENKSITNLSRSDFGQFKALRVLYLYDNQLTEFNLRVLEPCLNLEEVYLQSNEIAYFECIPKQAGSFTKLNFIDLSRNRIASFGPVQLPRLKKLNLSSQKDETTLDWKQASQMDSLEHLNVSRNAMEFSSVLSGILGSCPELKTLLIKACNRNSSSADSISLQELLSTLSHPVLSSLDTNGTIQLKCSSSRELRALVLSSFPNLTKLDGRAINPLERRLYLRATARKSLSNLHLNGGIET